MLREEGHDGEIVLSPISCTPSTPPSASPTAAPPPQSSPRPTSPSCSLRSPRSASPCTTPILGLSELLCETPSPSPPGLPESPPSAATLENQEPPSSPSHQTATLPTNAGFNIPATPVIPAAPPMSSFFPNCPFKVICRYCLRDNHDVRYRQCPNCYKKRGGTNYHGW